VHKAKKVENENRETLKKLSDTIREDYEGLSRDLENDLMELVNNYAAKQLSYQWQIISALESLSL
jgi:hypothetical protein